MPMIPLPHPHRLVPFIHHPNRSRCPPNHRDPNRPNVRANHRPGTSNLPGRHGHQASLRRRGRRHSQPDAVRAHRDGIDGDDVPRRSVRQHARRVDPDVARRGTAGYVQGQRRQLSQGRPVPRNSVLGVRSSSRRFWCSEASGWT